MPIETLSKPVELEDVLASLMSVLLELSQENGNPFISSYGEIGLAARLKNKEVRAALIVLRERGIFRVEPMIEPTRMDVQRRFNLRFTRGEIATKARDTAARQRGVPFGFRHDSGVINTIGDAAYDKWKREETERLEKEDAAFMEEAKEEALRIARGRCQLCRRASSHLSVTPRGGIYRVQVRGPHDLVVMCDACGTILERYFKPSQAAVFDDEELELE
jgi:hypothetical protein